MIVRKLNKDGHPTRSRNTDAATFLIFSCIKANGIPPTRERRFSPQSENFPQKEKSVGSHSSPRLSADSSFPGGGSALFDCDELPPDIRENFLIGGLHELACPDGADFFVVCDVSVVF